MPAARAGSSSIPTETRSRRQRRASLRIKWKFRDQSGDHRVAVGRDVDLPGEGRDPGRLLPVVGPATSTPIGSRDGSEVWRFAVEDQPGRDLSRTLARSTSARRRRPSASSSPPGRHVRARRRAPVPELWRFQRRHRLRLRSRRVCAASRASATRSSRRRSSPTASSSSAWTSTTCEAGKGGFYAVDARDGPAGLVLRPRDRRDLPAGSPGDDIRRFDGYHTEAELGLPAGFLATRAGCDFPREPNGCGNVWSSARVRRRARGSCSSRRATATRTTTPGRPAPAADAALRRGDLLALGLDGTPAWRWRPREVDNDDLSFGAVPNLFTIDVGGRAARRRGRRRQGRHLLRHRPRRRERRQWRALGRRRSVEDRAAPPDR